jgi:hypothetical protein
MQGFSYSQLFSALQVWPLKSSVAYLASLNRIIFLGELRVIKDLDLDIFDVNDQVALAPAASSLPKPSGSQPISFTAPLALGAVSATLTTPWAGVTGAYVVTFSDNEIQSVTLTNAATTATWPLPMVGAVSVNAVIASQFIVERNLWVVYSGATKALVKRSWDFLQAYLGAAAGRPFYYADQGQNTWIFGPAADANATAIKRRYVQRPPSIVVAQNTWIGDNTGDLLFSACLMEAEHWLKADDRYADMKTKYYEELLPNARGEVMLAARSGVYAPLAPIASVPGPPPQAGAPAG